MRHVAKPEFCKRKDDTSKNSEGLEVLIAKQREKEKRMYKVRVNKNTIVMRVKK